MCHFGDYTDDWAYESAREDEEAEDEIDEPESPFADMDEAEDVRIVTDGGDDDE
ncbi:hypothetical protein [Haloquadratum walsbyi]|jgi:hypothetical protein|uniref:Uncharacterized protein n=3 Tax=Haloquadratum walsbyi TaxID=293091 RepID=Q18KC3_HALWD|nr:hypothetical protein [Haloquadratum walsbyi]ERG90607.1 MAG: hypothetical protein J07HQW1_00631 [Haloquadratum walsbyi J07HQW1]CAJ51528.1 uncharacterized protein HQ_1400A [Haloquadratum walsbyi DSM 16790]CCC39422.1 uncharacterized protein Hqrw_1475 [Haloquadratum walsbyi C23]